MGYRPIRAPKRNGKQSKRIGGKHNREIPRKFLYKLNCKMVVSLSEVIF